MDLNTKNNLNIVEGNKMIQNQNLPKLDAKDFAILKELDTNFRQSYSKIGRKVKLSKNSVGLRFEKLKQYFSDNHLVGINHETLGYSQIRIFFSFNFYNFALEEKLINEIKKAKNVHWVSRLFGHYELCLCFYIKDVHELISQLNEIMKHFENKISLKDLHIIKRQYHFRHNYLYTEPIKTIYKIGSRSKRKEISKIEKKILNIFRNNPRENILFIAKKSNLTPKTVSTNIKILEKKGVIMGYFLTVNPIKFGYVTFKLFLSIQHTEKDKEFEKELTHIKNIRYLGVMIGQWDYEIDFNYQNLTELQEEIELLKDKFPDVIKKIEVISLGKRILTNVEAGL